MESYSDLQKQIAALQEKAEDARKKELVGVIEQIKSQMDLYKISIKDIQGEGVKTPKKLASKGQYKNPDKGDETWSGRGKPPKWMRDLTDSGRKKEEFLIYPPTDSV